MSGWILQIYSKWAAWLICVFSESSQSTYFCWHTFISFIMFLKTLSSYQKCTESNQARKSCSCRAGRQGSHTSLTLTCLRPSAASSNIFKMKLVCGGERYFHWLQIIPLNPTVFICLSWKLCTWGIYLTLSELNCLVCTLLLAVICVFTWGWKHESCVRVRIAPASWPGHISPSVAWQRSAVYWLTSTT